MTEKVFSNEDRGFSDTSACAAEAAVGTNTDPLRRCTIHKELRVPHDFVLALVRVSGAGRAGRVP